MKSKDTDEEEGERMVWMMETRTCRREQEGWMSSTSRGNKATLRCTSVKGRIGRAMGLEVSIAVVTVAWRGGCVDGV